MSVRPRKTPKLNLTAKCLQELIAWNIPDCHEPVFTCQLTKASILRIIEVPFQVPKFCIHTQSTERCVKLATKASKAVFIHDKREGFI